MVAYQAGNAANIAAAATISHTSLPSQSGPMVLIAARRPASSRATTACSMPTPRSKPSRTKKPVHSTAMTMNQNVANAMRTTSGWSGRSERSRPRAAPASGLVGHRWNRLVFTGSGRRQLLSCVLGHHHGGDGCERRVQQEEHDDAGGHLRGADGRGHAVPGEHDALDDPGLAPAFGQQPS